ncbi:MAG: NAD(P)/FAD-dependent oxidoreductase [Flaviaesturariibacter sp.]|nr:NAD(P)/FAD-dependent oxidoreductase [Flaviaesturariibacter sp.]
MDILQPKYDVAIVGGGLAGLACAIRLRKGGNSVVLFEKEAFPFHRVCGEYISMESWDFLKQLGVPLDSMNLPKIDTLQLTAPKGTSFTTPLPLGGFGISRYTLDALLAAKAKEWGVHLLEETKVEEVVFNGDHTVSFTTKGGGRQEVNAMVCCAAWGKRSNLDVKWNRSFLSRQDKRLQNFVGIKYHLKADWPASTIGLHNFKDGYCGISRIEEGKYCLCYMVKADELKSRQGDIKRLEREVLSGNPHLKKLLAESGVLEGFPVTISQINFSPKTLVENHVLMIGDAAGMITPLCGNGMSIALHTGKIASDKIHHFLAGKTDRDTMERDYAREWKGQFAARLRRGRWLQWFFGSTGLSNAFVGAFKRFPFLASPVIRSTHGNLF